MPSRLAPWPRIVICSLAWIVATTTASAQLPQRTTTNQTRATGANAQQFGGGQQGQFNTGAGGASSVDRTLDNGFIGRDEDAGFVGNSAAGNARRAAQQPNFRGLSQRQRPNVRSSSNTSPIRVPVQLSSGLLTSSTLSSSRLSKPFTPALNQVSQNITVQIEQDGTAVLTGTVATAQQRQLAAALARLEPGISRVTNLITVSE